MNEDDLITQKIAGISSVDLVKITVLVDNVVPFATQLIGEHGLSIFVQVQNGNNQYNILLDTGKSQRVLLENMEKLNISVDSIDAVFLSHCHYDHTGGLEGFIKNRSQKTQIISHPSLFRNNFRFDEGIKSLGLPSRVSQDSLVNEEAELFFAKNPFELYPGVLSSGQINRKTDFEGKGMNTFQLDPESGKIIKDILLDDMALIVNVKDKGLLILTGCSHSGIVNIIHHARDITGIDKVYGVFGGFHLVNAEETTIQKTANEILIFSPEILAAGHCTGFKAMSYFNNHFNNFWPLGVGSVYKV